MYKLVKYAIDKEYGNCLTPCPYGLEGFGQIMVASGSCQDCKHHKGKVKKQVKCSFEYEMKDQEPSEIKIGKVTSSDCGSDCVCKEEVEKSCDTCEYRSQGWYLNPCDTCTRGITQQKISLNWKPKVADEVEKSCITCKHNNDDECMYDGKCNLGTLDGWNSGKSVKVEEFEPNKKVMRQHTKIQPNKSSWIFKNGQEKIYVSLRHGDNVINIKPYRGEEFKFEGGSTALQRWRGVAELIIEAIDYLESEGM
jgi:hypothetical protein